jgi:proteasome accessory factor A
MIEDGMLDEDFLALEDPVRAIKDISHDPTCRCRVRLKRGKEFTAVELQREYLAKALDYYSGRETPPQVADLLERWGRVLDGLAEDPMSLHRELDWVIKAELLRSYARKKGCGFDDHRVALLDLQYHDLRRDKGLYYKLEQGGYVERIVTDAEIERAVMDPPMDTRAYFRGTCLQKFGDQIYGASWSSVIFDTGEAAVKKIPMAEPSRGTRKLVGEILERSETVAELLERLSA